MRKQDVATSHPEMVADLQTRLAEHQAKDNPKLPEDLVGLPK